MDHPTMLTDILKLHFAGGHLARRQCLSSLSVALFKVKTVNLTHLATTFPGRAEVDAHSRRLPRFFQHLEINPALSAHVVVSFLPYTPYTFSYADQTRYTHLAYEWKGITSAQLFSKFAPVNCLHALWCPTGLWSYAFTGVPGPSGDYLIIVSDDPCDHGMDAYQNRWDIEVLFAALKSRGFNFEDTH